MEKAAQPPREGELEIDAARLLPLDSFYPPASAPGLMRLGVLAPSPGSFLHAKIFFPSLMKSSPVPPTHRGRTLLRISISPREQRREVPVRLTAFGTGHF